MVVLLWSMAVVGPMQLPLLVTVVVLLWWMAVVGPMQLPLLATMVGLLWWTAVVRPMQLPLLVTVLRCRCGVGSLRKESEGIASFLRRGNFMLLPRLRLT
uniref:Uncharacterized protein n=1 Tax=Ixodes ricinus TaxID=34613 RepID=A0A6B0UEL5_IXORI